MVEAFDYQWNNEHVNDQALMAARAGQLNAKQQWAVVLALIHLSQERMVRVDVKGGEKAHQVDEWSKTARQALVMAATPSADVTT